MAQVRLKTFDNSWFQPGRSRFIQAAWFFLGNPVLRCALIPSSGLRVWLLKLFGASIGEGAVVKPGVRVKYPWKLRVGTDCWIGEDCWIDNLAPVSIGSDVCLSQGVYLCTGNHDWSDPAFGLIVKPITIADGAWIAAKAVVAPGVEVGECAIAAIGSVVNQNIPAREVHAGNPARIVTKRRFESAMANTQAGFSPALAETQ